MVDHRIHFGDKCSCLAECGQCWDCAAVGKNGENARNRGAHTKGLGWKLLIEGEAVVTNPFRKNQSPRTNLLYVTDYHLRALGVASDWEV